MTLGAGYLLLLAAHAGSGGVGEEQLGEHAHEITAFVDRRFGGEIHRVEIAIVAAALVIGALVGIAAGSLVRLRDRFSGRWSRAPLSLAMASLPVIVFLQGWQEAWGMANSPQLYAEAFYAQGGYLRSVQVVVTDVLGRRGVLLGGLVALAVYAAGPTSQWPRWPGRFQRALAPVKLLMRRAAVPVTMLVGVACVLALGLPRVVCAALEGPPNILILAADSLRADRIDPRVAPHLADLAARGTRFERAYVSLPRTFPSWVTLLTGRHPHHHGIRSMFPRWEDRAKDFDALPSRLARAGYRTSVVSDYAGDIFRRIDLGFRDVETPTFDFRQLVRQRALERETPLLPTLHSRLGRKVFPVLRELNDAADPSMLADDAIAALHRAGDQPFFLTVFFSTAHFPYAAPAPYYARFSDPSYRGRFKYHKPVGLGREAPPDPDDVRQVRALYDGAVSSIDDAAERVLDALERENKADRTIVVVLADHGETLYENDHGQGHGDHLFGDAGIHIPLIVFDPRKKGGHRETRVVRDVDLAPTLYELTKVAPPNDLDGRSLVPSLDGAPLAPAFAYAETGLWFTENIAGLAPELRLPYPDISRLTEIDGAHGDELVLQSSVRPLTLMAKHRMVRDERYKMIYAPTRMGVKYMLFDTQRDPEERVDVAATHPAELTRLKNELNAWMLRDKSMILRGDYLLPADEGPLSSGASQASTLRLGAP